MAKDSWQSIDTKPLYGENYKPGYIGFTFTDGSFISSGIAWFTRWDRKKGSDVPNLKLSHVVLVVDKDTVLEATWPRIKLTPIAEFFDDPDIHICFRKPKGLTPEIAAAMIEQGSIRIGEKYDISLIVGQLLKKNLIGRLFSMITFRLSDKLLTKLFDKARAAVCSEFIAWCMKSSGFYTLKRIPADYSPLELFQDEDLFEPWDTDEMPDKEVVNP